MTSQQESTSETESEVPVIDMAAREIRKVANAPDGTMMKYVVVCVLLLFGAMTWYSWQSNQRNPDRLYALLEKSIDQQVENNRQQAENNRQQVESMKMQEKALHELQRFSIQVPMEHNDHAKKLEIMHAELKAEISKVSVSQDALREAVMANTEILGRLLEAMKANASQANATWVPNGPAVDG